MNKKIIPFFILVLLLSAGIIALTQESDLLIPDIGDFKEEQPGLTIPSRWFKSNAAGMALEETPSKLAALRSEYALEIISARDDEILDFLLPYYDSGYNPEIRVLYRNSEQSRTQWLFRDENSITRLNAVFVNTEISENKNGFIEIFDENSVLTEEYRFYENGGRIKTEYELKENLLISAAYFLSDNSGDYAKVYEDFYRYNRALSLRSIERIYIKDVQVSYDRININFPIRIMDTINNSFFITERINLYPDFFGDVFIASDSRMIFDTDERGRILKQTLYDDEDNIIFIIVNTWANNRIVSTNKTEGDTVLLSEFQYNSSGDRILERNYKNGALERLVRTEGNTETEELFINNILVLRAVWEDGIMTSETRITN